MQVKGWCKHFLPDKIQLLLLVPWFTVRWAHRTCPPNSDPMRCDVGIRSDLQCYSETSNHSPEFYTRTNHKIGDTDLTRHWHNVWLHKYFLSSRMSRLNRIQVSCSCWCWNEPFGINMEIYEYYVPVKNIITPFLVWVGVNTKEETIKCVTI